MIKEAYLYIWDDIGLLTATFPLLIILRLYMELLFVEFVPINMYMQSYLYKLIMKLMDGVIHI